MEHGNKPISSEGVIIENGNSPPLPFTFGAATDVKGNGMAPNFCISVREVTVTSGKQS